MHRLYNHTVTVVNKINNKGNVTLHAHVLVGVHYQDKQGIKTGSTVQFTDNQGYVQIPHSIEGYVNPIEYAELKDFDGKWTLKEGDYIAKGIYDLKEGQKTTEGLRTIDSIENIDYAITMQNHYGITLK